MAFNSVGGKLEVGTQFDTEADCDSSRRPDTAPSPLRALKATGAVEGRQVTVHITDSVCSPPESKGQARQERLAAQLKTQSVKNHRTHKVIRCREPTRKPKAILNIQTQQFLEHGHCELSLQSHRKTQSEVSSATYCGLREEREAKVLMEKLHRHFAQHLTAPAEESEKEMMRTFSFQPRSTLRSNSNGLKNCSQTLTAQPLLLIRGVSCSTSVSKAASPLLISPPSPACTTTALPSARERPFRCYARAKDWLSIGASPATVNVLSTDSSTPSFILKTNSAKPKRPSTSSMLRMSIRQEATICTGPFRGAKLLSASKPGVAFLREPAGRPSPNHFLTARTAFSSRARVREPQSLADCLSS